jgi:TRAP-type C4-dicarboxylate transport system permease small subunit
LEINRVMARLDSAIIWLTAIAVVSLMLTMVASILAGVFFRYVVNAALPWPEELARFAMIWLTMLGAGLVTRYGGHIAVTIFVGRLRGGPKLLVMWLGRAAVVLFLVLLLWFGADMTGRAGRQHSAVLGWSMSIPNLAIPLGAGLILYHLGMIFFRREDAEGRPPPLPFER